MKFRGVPPNVWVFCRKVLTSRSLQDGLFFRHILIHLVLRRLSLPAGESGVEEADAFTDVAKPVPGKRIRACPYGRVSFL